MSTYSSVLALYPKSPEPSATFATTTEPSRPAFSTIVLNGDSTARDTIWIPVASSALSALIVLSAFLALNKATPPPATIPSSTAARVA